MTQAAVRHAFYFTVAACSIAAMTCQAVAGSGDGSAADASVVARALGGFDNPRDVVALVASQIAR